MTDRRAAGEPAHRSSARGTRVYNVIDSRQSYLQDVVVAGLRALGFEEQADAVDSLLLRDGGAVAAHAASSWGSSSPRKTSKRPYVEVSGRKGLGVKADDLIDKLIEKALEEVASRHPDDAAKSSAARGHRRSRSARCATSC